jgi:hypothetical protein
MTITELLSAFRFFDIRDCLCKSAFAARWIWLSAEAPALEPSQIGCLSCNDSALNPTETLLLSPVQAATQKCKNQIRFF